jgi:hypothetical protein
MSDRTANRVIALVAAVWAANMIAAMWPGSNYQPPEAVNGAFMTIVGGAFLARSRARNGNGTGSEEK